MTTIHVYNKWIVDGQVDRENATAYLIKEPPMYINQKGICKICGRDYEGELAVGSKCPSDDCISYYERVSDKEFSMSNSRVKAARENAKQEITSSILERRFDDARAMILEAREIEKMLVTARFTLITEIELRDFMQAIAEGEILEGCKA